MLTTCCVALVCLAVPDAEPSRRGTARLVEPDKVLDQMFKEFLFDPIEAQRVRVRTMVRTTNRTQLEVEREGWLVATKAKNPARVYFAGGESIPAPPPNEIMEVDFVVECRRRYATESATPMVRARERVWLDREAPEVRDGLDLVLAAWLWRLGEPDLAAKALDRAAREGQTLAQLRQELARKAYADLVFAHESAEDEETLLHGERLLRLYGPEAKAFAQTQPILDGLEWQARNGTLGKRRKFPGADRYDGMAEKEKIAFLIEVLSEVQTGWRRLMSSHGFSDWEQPLPALNKFGDRAVPLLIDAVEKDKRLTRQVDGYYNWDQQLHYEPRVITVREAALEVLQTNLRLHTFRTAAVEKIRTGSGDDLKQAGAELRAYWRRYGTLPFADRMQKMLTEPTTNFEMTREAAWNLGTLRGVQASGIDVEVGADALPLLDRRRDGGWRELWRLADPAKKGHERPPAAETDSSFAAGEAILGAMQRDLEANNYGFVANIDEPRRIEDDYVAALIELGDRRFAKLLARRAGDAWTVWVRRKLAYTAHCLGDDTAWKSYAADVQVGKVKLPANNRQWTADSQQPGIVELLGMVEMLSLVRLPESEQALTAFTDRKHPYYALLAPELTYWFRWHTEGFFKHPYCLAILGQELERAEPTGVTLMIEGKWLRRLDLDGGEGGSGVPDCLQDPAARLEKGAERYHDRAAVRLGELVFSMPDYQPLLKDHAQVFEQVRTTYRRFHGRFRLLHTAEKEALGLSRGEQLFVPDVQPLGKPATATDVRAGKALFHLGGIGNRANLALPATAVLKRDAADKAAPRVLIVQAETANGVTTYGVIARHAILVLTADELDDIKPVAEKKADR